MRFGTLLLSRKRQTGTDSSKILPVPFLVVRVFQKIIQLRPCQHVRDVVALVPLFRQARERGLRRLEGDAEGGQRVQHHAVAQRGELLYALKHAFNGALTPMVQCLLASQKLSESDIAEIEALIRERKRRKQ